MTAISWTEKSLPATATKVTAQNGDAWGVCANGDVYHYSDASGLWVQEPNLPTSDPFVNLSASFDGSVFGTTNQGDLYLNSFGLWSTTPLEHSVLYAALGDVDNYAVIKSNGATVTSSYGSVDTLSTYGAPTKISVTAGLTDIWGITGNGAVSYYSGTTWEPVTGKNLQQIHIFMNYDGELQVFGVESITGKGVRYANGSWSNISFPSGVTQFTNIESGNGYVWASTSNGQIFRASI